MTLGTRSQSPLNPDGTEYPQQTWVGTVFWQAGVLRLSAGVQIKQRRGGKVRGVRQGVAKWLPLTWRMQESSLSLSTVKSLRGVVRSSVWAGRSTILSAEARKRGMQCWWRGREYQDGRRSSGLGRSRDLDLGQEGTAPFRPPTGSPWSRICVR